MQHGIRLRRGKFAARDLSSSHSSSIFRLSTINTRRVGWGGGYAARLSYATVQAQ